MYNTNNPLFYHLSHIFFYEKPLKFKQTKKTGCINSGGATESFAEKNLDTSRLSQLNGVERMLISCHVHHYCYLFVSYRHRALIGCVQKGLSLCELCKGERACLHNPAALQTKS